MAEGGYTSLPVGPFTGTARDQVDYLQAIHAQIGERLDFWIYLIINDLNLRSWSAHMKHGGMDEDLPTLGIFEFVGLTTVDRRPKPALEVWDSFRERAANFKQDNRVH